MLKPTLGQRQDLLKTLKSLCAQTEGRQGCVECLLCVEEKPRCGIFSMQRWESPEDFRRYLRSDLYRKVLALMEVPDVAPELQFYYVTQTSGLEAVEEARQ